MTVLATEITKGIASDASKDLWKQIKSLLGWTADPAPADTSPALAQRLVKDDTLCLALVDILKANAAQHTTAGNLVGNLTVSGGKVIIANYVQTINM